MDVRLALSARQSEIGTPSSNFGRFRCIHFLTYTLGKSMILSLLLKLCVKYHGILSYLTLVGNQSLIRIILTTSLCEGIRNQLGVGLATSSRKNLLATETVVWLCYFTPQLRGGSWGVIILIVRL